MAEDDFCKFSAGTEHCKALTLHRFWLAELYDSSSPR
jgi:hypothetical protein